MRKLSPAGRDFIQKWEGLRLIAYLCPAGVWTIGYGATSMSGQPVKRGDRISKARAEELLDLHIAAVVASIYQLTPASKIERLSQGQFDALVSFVYNVGPGAYRYGSKASAKTQKGTGSVYAAVMAGSPQAMAMGLRKYVMAGGKVSPGLKKRREEEAQMVLSAGTLPTPPDVPTPEPLPAPPDTPPAPAPPERNWTAIGIGGAVIVIIVSIISWIFGGAQ